MDQTGAPQKKRSRFTAVFRGLGHRSHDEESEPTKAKATTTQTSDPTKKSSSIVPEISSKTAAASSNGSSNLQNQRRPPHLIVNDNDGPRGRSQLRDPSSNLPSHLTERSLPVSPTTSAFQNLRVSPDRSRRQGLRPGEFEELTRNAASSSAQVSSVQNAGANTLIQFDVPSSATFSINASAKSQLSNPFVRRKEAPSAPSKEKGEEKQRMHDRRLDRTSGEEQDDDEDDDENKSPPRGRMGPPPFPHLRSLRGPAQQTSGTHPPPPVSYPPHLRQPFIPRRPVLNDGRYVQARPIANLPNSGISNLPLHATLTPTSRTPPPHLRPQPHFHRKITPPNMYTSPDRLPRAILAASLTRKRKRPGLTLPPPAFTYRRTNSPHFNIFSGILLFPELVFHLSTQLPLASLLDLYAISHDFHTILDSRFTTAMLSQTLLKAPESARAFPWRCYASLCRPDPAQRIPHPDPLKATNSTPRLIPSLRWVKMILFREKTVHEIMALFAEDGVPLPARCSLALKRMWFLLDIPDNARRIGYIHNPNLMSDLDLYFLTAFFVKLDMRLNAPTAPTVHPNLRKLLLSQPSLSYLAAVLRREKLRNSHELMQEWIRYRYTPLADEVGMDIFGVRAEEVGKLRWEYWGRSGDGSGGGGGPGGGLNVNVLLRPEQLVIREVVRRGLRFRRHYLRCALYGYVRPDTLEDYAPRTQGRRVERLKDEYGVRDEVGGSVLPPAAVMKSGDGEEGVGEGEGEGTVGVDELLDLGERKEVSRFCVRVEGMGVGREERSRREGEEAFLGECLRWWREEADGMLRDGPDDEDMGMGIV